MPKAKPTQVIVHRIELQQTERDALEAALAGKFVTNGVSAAGSVLTGIGSFLAPFGGVFTALFALWAVDKTWDAAAAAGSQLKEDTIQDMESAGAPCMNAFASYLNSRYALDGRAGICDTPQWRQGMLGPQNLKPSIQAHYVNLLQMKCPAFFIIQMHNFLEFYCAQLSLDDERHQQTAVELWEQFYTIEQFGIDAYYYTQKAYTDSYPDPFGWLMEKAGWPKS